MACNRVRPLPLTTPGRWIGIRAVGLASCGCEIVPVGYLMNTGPLFGIYEHPFDMTPELYITSQHKLRVAMRPDEGSASLPTATSARIERAFNDGEGAGLLHLATIEIKTALGPTLAFARGFAQRYFTQLCHLGEPDVQPETELVVPPGEEELSAIVLEAPPMRGLEYLDAGALRTAWCELDTRVRLEVSAHGKGVRASPLAHRWRPLQPGEKQGTLPRTGSV
jgi:hypothetical protein